MRRVIKWIAIIVLIIIVVLAALMVTLSTERGTRFVINQVQKWVPALTIDQVNGNLRHLQLSDVTYQQSGIMVHVGEIDQQLHLTCLFRQTLCVPSLVISHVNIEIHSDQIPISSPSASAATRGQFSLPLALSIDQLALNDIHANIDGTALALSTFTTSAEMVGHSVVLQNSLLDKFIITPSTQPDPKTAPKKITESPQSTPIVPFVDRINQLFAKPLQLPAIDLPFNIHLMRFEGHQIEYRTATPFVIYDANISASNLEHSVSISQCDIDSSQGKLQLNGKVALQDNWPINIALSAYYANAQPRLEQMVKMTLTGSVLEGLTLNGDITGTMSAHVDASVALGKANLPLALHVKTDRLTWPLSGDPDYTLSNVNVSAKGSLKHYQLNGQLSLAGKQIPTLELHVQGQGDLTHFSVQPLKVNMLNGTVETIGELNWGNGLTFNQKINIKRINSGSYLPNYPAKINGVITVSGAWQDPYWSLDVQKTHLFGQIKDQPFDIQGAVKGNSQLQWLLSDIVMQLGKNRLSVTGKLDHNVNIHADIDAPELGHILPQLAGKIEGRMNVEGTLDKPVVHSQLTVQHFVWQTIRVGAMQLNANIDSKPMVHGALTLKMNDTSLPSVAITEMNLSLTGDEKQHQLTLNLNGQPIHARIALTGGFDRHKGRWSGQLNQSLIDSAYGDWRLQSPSRLTYSIDKNQVQFDKQCWGGHLGEFCLQQGSQVGASGNVHLLINRIGLNALQQILKLDSMLMMGDIHGKVDASWQPNQKMPNVEAKIEGRSLLIESQGESKLPVRLQTVEMFAKANAQQIQATTQVGLEGQGKLISALTIDDPLGAKVLHGQVTIKNISLSLLMPLLKTNDDARGMVNAELAISGDLQRPLLNGRLHLEHAKLKGDWLPVQVEEGNLLVKFNGQSSTLSGDFNTDTGKLVLSGQADWQDFDKLHAVVKAKGEHLKVVIQPYGYLFVSPDVELDVLSNRLHLNGVVSIPESNIEIKQLPQSVVDVSPDQVLLDDKGQPINDAKSLLNFSSQLAIHLGDSVSFKGFGFKTHLKGSLVINQDKQGINANGDIFLNKGAFQAYGQDLIIRKGELIFSGPVQKPLLSVEAIRNPESIQNSVVAGVRISGHADKPKMTLFSEPVMEDQQVLSYLLRGQPLDSDSQGDNALITNLLIGLGTSQGQNVFNRIGDSLGIKQLSLDTRGVGNTSQVVVSGYLTPKLRVQYGVGIFDSLATLTLRYQLMPRLYMEAASGIDQSIDFLYQFSFN